jgi:hypothetical protein
MIHIITVHYKSDFWIDIQFKYLNHFIKEPFRVYASLTGIDSKHYDKFFYYNTEPIASHGIKLNFLAEIAYFNSEDPENDILIFLDGDAFPIDFVHDRLKDKLKKHPLIAIRGGDITEDIQPHPCFCITTLKFWKDIKGDWKPGYKWKSRYNKMITDTGGNLLQILQHKNINWLRLNRSNKINLHPYLFGVYENMIYHHGAGFRSPMLRSDAGKFYTLTIVPMYKILPRFFLAILSLLFLSKKTKRNIQISNSILASLQKDFQFYKPLLTSNINTIQKELGIKINKSMLKACSS